MWPDWETWVAVGLFAVVAGIGVWIEVRHPPQRTLPTQPKVVGTAPRFLQEGEWVSLEPTDTRLFRMEEPAAAGSLLEINPSTGMLRKYRGA